ncbi:katanin p80 WD40 repeat-containing subunit B1 isoform X2 [Brachionus plicatilis]|uniref:Katanin p80 WD40 repeat-containing subunit B1 isoform X2 n=1 Tax=Brachionus plicatilis TaxID=10195 RepID=A0A3M7SFR2_BRAPC|nr:katanin p80 WD40 repeat-containing subunit B1 isoform X2 [Brachionus plicatilis]
MHLKFMYLTKILCSITMNLNNAAVGQPNKRSIKLNEFIAHGSAVTACALGHKSACLAATGGDDKKSLNGHTSSIQSISFSSNEDKIVSGSASGSYADYIASGSGSIDSQIRLWDLRKKGCIFTYKGHTDCINALRFSPDSKWLASASDDSLVKIWDLKAGRLLVDLKGHQCAVNSLEFHPYEFLLASGSTDRTVKFWDLEKMENVSTSPILLNSVKIVKFETNGRCLFSASHDNLQSISWEPSEIHDSVYCQWKNVSDMCISSNKLIASSFTKNMVSIFAVDLLQVAPIGSPPQSEDRFQILPNKVKKPVSALNDTNGPNANHLEPKRSTLNRITKENSPGDKQNFFLDIRTNQPPTQPQSQPVVQPAPTFRQTFTLSPNFNSDNIKKNLSNEANGPAYRQSIIEDPVQPVKMNVKKNPNDQIMSEKLKLSDEIRDKIEIEPKKNLHDDKTIDENENLAFVIENGHENFMKEMKMRSRKLQSICVMWNSGNIKPALDHAVNLKDGNIMANILNEINSLNSLWNLDICTILLPSIRNLISSRYEEYMLIGSESCKLVFKNFGKLIKSNLMSASNVGVSFDISREERFRKSGNSRICDRSIT